MTRSSSAATRIAAALVLGIAGTSQSLAQSGPYYQTQQPAAAYAQYPATAQTVQPQITVPPIQVQPTGYPTAQPSYRTAQYQLPNYQAPAPAARYAMADDTTPAAPEHVPAPESLPQTAPVQEYTEGDPATEASQYPAGDSATGWEGYVQAPTSGYGCETGDCTTGAACDYGTFGGGSSSALGGRLFNNCGRQWFFGAYSLFMSRDNPSYTRFATVVDEPAPSTPYYPSSMDTVLSTENIEPDWQWGAEIRFGSTFGSPCGPGLGLRPYAWEVVYWGLAEDSSSATITDAWTDGDRMYSAINYNGLNYDRDGSAGGTYADRPLNDYWDYSMPVDETNDIRVLGFRARSYFSAQNLELNFLRFPIAGGGDACNACAPPRFTVNGLCGVRYMKLDEDLQYAAMFVGVDGTGTPNAGEPTAYTGFPLNDDNNIFHDISTDNELVGFQIGSNMNWLIGCKWSAFCDTSMGIYGNNASVYQTVYGGGGGMVTWDGSGNAVNVLAKKTDVSFLGELRAGLGYQVGCNCRITTAYRVIAITGVALANEQLPSVWSDSDYVARTIDTNDSMILHGLQTGVEWKY
ncbi:BBP7 family outer membrane beta-barrel protein [Aeoliella mucimassa]|uniref:Uncharacterized protein n=1 Tax=Aeoliella mucimassa TaxID=2527972 RepID=A0A518AGX0_9BACT|nr:BBP7 family outer membrane beta-barrel protein [Aeoliella mucimassa]QDU53976.1 hypothetical protein Pan181_01550 [Aeoliella mucimassa]